jgi:hypothetical protein
MRTDRVFWQIVDGSYSQLEYARLIHRSRAAIREISSTCSSPRDRGKEPPYMGDREHTKGRDTQVTRPHIPNRQRNRITDPGGGTKLESSSGNSDRENP